MIWWWKSTALYEYHAVLGVVERNNGTADKKDSGNAGTFLLRMEITHPVVRCLPIILAPRQRADIGKLLAPLGRLPQQTLKINDDSQYRK